MDIKKKKKKRKNVIFKNHHVATRIAHSDSCTAPPFAAGDDRHLRTLRLWSMSAFKTLCVRERLDSYLGEAVCLLQ